MRNVSDKSCRGNQNTHFVFSNFFENRAIVLDKLEKCVRVGQATDDNVMRIACWIPKPTNTPSEYIIRIAFPLQQWLHERTSVLRYTYIVCIVGIFLYCDVAC